MRTLLVLATLTTALLSGCADGADAPGDAASPSGSLQEEARSAGGEPVPQPEPVQGRETDPHGEVAREESAVEAELQQDGTWIAWYTVTLANGVGDFQAAAVSFDAASGGINATGAQAGGYRVAATVEARGLTEQLARDELARHTVVHEDRLEGDALALATYLESEPQAEIPTPVGPITINLSSASFRIDALLPDHLLYELDLDAASGSIRAEHLRGGTMSFDAASGSIQGTDLAACDVQADAASGGITLTEVVACAIEADAASGSISVAASRAASLAADAASGSIDLEGTFDDVEVDVSSGSVRAHLTPGASGSYRFDSASGSIDVTLGQGGGCAYDVTAEASSGTVTVQLQDGETVEADEDGRFVHARTAGFDDAGIQTTVTADAASGSITIVG